MCPEESQNLSNLSASKLTISFFTVFIRKISGTSSVVAIRTCHVAILEQSQITPRMLKIPTVQTEKPYWSNAKCFRVCASSLVIAGEYVTRSQVFLMQRWPFITFPLTFYAKNNWAGFFLSRSVFKMLRSFHVFVDYFFFNWTWLVLEELN